MPEVSFLSNWYPNLFTYGWVPGLSFRNVMSGSDPSSFRGDSSCDASRLSKSVSERDIEGRNELLVSVLCDVFMFTQSASDRVGLYDTFP